MTKLTHHPETVSQVVEAVGRKRLAEKLDTSEQAISNVIREDIFPARWYNVVRDLCGDVGIPCPDSLFKFRVVNET